MTLEKALSYAIDKEGLAIITEARLANYLNDLQAFDSSAVKRIVSTMIDEGYFAKLQSGLTSDSYELQFNDVRSYLVQNEGFQADLVNYVLDCLLFAVHKTGNVPTIPQSAVETKKPAVKRSSVSKKADLQVVHANDNYLVTLNGQSYELDESQFKAIMRKKDMPANRLEVWLQTYAEENNHGRLLIWLRNITVCPESIRGRPINSSMVSLR